MWTLFSLWARKPRARRSRIRSFRPRVRALEDRCLLSGGGLQWSDPNPVHPKTINDLAFAVAVQPDGKIVAAGEYGAAHYTVYLQVIRYNSSGTLDNSFGSGGMVQTQVPSIGGGGSVLVQPDGKILVLMNVNETFELVRFTSTGTLDTTFNGTGMVNTAFPYPAQLVHGLGLETVNGVTEIVAGGTVILNGTQDAFALARYNLNGTLDTTFGTGGEVVTSYGAALENLAIQEDGKIVAAGAGGNGNFSNFTLARYDLNGNLDSTFGNAGISTGPPGWAMAVVVQPDGKIVAAGDTYSGTGAREWGLECVNSDGSLDTTFGTGGLVLGPGSGFIRGLVLQTNGKLVVDGDAAGFALARYNADGSLDTSFGTGGQVLTQLNGRGDSYALALEANGDIIAAGQAPPLSKNGQTEVAVASYSGDPVPVIGSFTASSYTVTAGTSVTLTASNITDANPGATITQVTFYYYDSTGTLQILGYGTQTSGTWTFTFSTSGLSSGSYTLYAQAEDNYGVFGDPFALTLTVQ
jgi:uncharacterized delta-60 repeat protein